MPFARYEDIIAPLLVAGRYGGGLGVGSDAAPASISAVSRVGDNARWLVSVFVTWESKPLRFGGTCSSCGVAIAQRDFGWHEPALKKARCASCGPGPVDAQASSLQTLTLEADPVGGSAALRDARIRHDHNYTKGAAGEYLMDISLHKHVNDGAVILTDRRVPGAESNIDHVVIAPSGVWIIDSKNWRGKIEYRASTRLGMDTRLYVGGIDRTSAVEKIFNLVIPVAQVIGDKSVPISQALVFIEGDWGSTSATRFLTNRPYQHLGVWISWPKAIWKKINEPGTLDKDDLQRLGALLDEQLRPR